MHVVVAGALGDRRLERIEVDDEEIDRLDTVLRRLRGVLFVAANGQQAAVHLRMQRLHAAVEHLRKSGELGDVLHGQSLGAQGRRRATGGDQLDAHAGERAGKLYETRLVGH